MQQKFKIGDKVKVLTSVYPGVYGTEGVVTKFGPGDVCMVERNADNYPPDQYGTFDHDSWRYCFYESELELVEDMPKTKFKAGDKVVCVRGSKNGTIPEEGKHYTVRYAYFDNGCEYVSLREDIYSCSWYTERFELATDQEKQFAVGDKVLLADCVAEVVSVKKVGDAEMIGVMQGSQFFVVHPQDLKPYKRVEPEVSSPEPNVHITVDVNETMKSTFNELKKSIEALINGEPEPDYVVGQEVYVSNDFNRYLRKGVLLDAIPRNGLMHVNIGGFDCYVEEERVYTREGTKGN